jgi:hypothetical protein
MILNDKPNWQVSRIFMKPRPIFSNRSENDSIMDFLSQLKLTEYQLSVAGIKVIILSGELLIYLTPRYLVYLKKIDIFECVLFKKRKEKSEI